MKKLKVAIIGGDKRQLYLAKELHKKGHHCIVYGIMPDRDEGLWERAMTLQEAMQKAAYIIGPVPFSRNQQDIYIEGTECIPSISSFLDMLDDRHVLFGGMLTKQIADYCEGKSILIYDFMQMETVSVENAIATAEGSIVEAIKESPCNLHGSRCLVLGYGRCGKILADKLAGLRSQVTVGARSSEQLSLADAYGHKGIPLGDIANSLHTYDVIFNTIPVKVLTRELLSLVKSEAVIIDIASKPGGTDFEAAKDLGICAKLCLGLPGIYAPKTSAQILVKAFLSCISEG